MRTSVARFLFVVGMGIALAAGAQPVKIVSPDKNATVTTSQIYVSGTIVSKTRQVGVVVNGFRAEVDIEHDGSKTDPFLWFATVPAPSGKVKLKARIVKHGEAPTESDDETAASVVNVTHIPGAEATLRASTTSGLVPLFVRFAVIHDLSDVTHMEADLDGDGSFEYSGAPVDQLQHTYAQSGLRIATLRITTRGGVVIAKTPISARTFSTMNVMLKQVWIDFVGAMSRGDVAAARAYFGEGTPRERYDPVLELIRPSLKTFAASLGAIAPLKIDGDVASYLLVRKEGETSYGHHVYFARDSQGLWKIIQM